jgi:gamma-glutamyltranspeptidase/glutathione hydrolase
MDAAVGAAVTQCVVDPLHCGIAGVGVLIAWSASRRETTCIRFWGPVGSLGRPDVFVHDLIARGPGQAPRVKGFRNRRGHASVVVPGFMRGVAEGFRRLGSGSVSWADIVAPAARIARAGFVVDDYVARYWDPEGLNIDDYPALERLNATAACAEIYLKDGRPYRAGERLVQRDFGRSLERLAAAGPDDFYEGEIASAIGADFAKHGGLFTRDDLARYRPLAGEPLWGTFDSLTVASDPPPGSGVQVIELLNILEGVDLRSLGWNSPRYQDTLARAMRQVFADRRAYMADPRFHPVPVARLTSKGYAAEVRSRVLAGHGPVMDAPAPEHVSPGHEGTTHVSVVDGEGNAAAITHTNHDGSGVVVPGFGFMFNNDMNSFDPIPGQRNSIGPGKMPVTGGAPTLLFRGQELAMVIGSPAGPLKVTAIAQTLINVLWFGMSLADAVAAERIHCEGAAIVLEPAFPEEKAEALRRLGNPVTRSGYTARLAAIYRPPGGTWQAGTDPRGGGGLAIVD